MSRLLGGDHLSIDAPGRLDLGVGICDEEPVEAIPFSVIEELRLGGITSWITKDRQRRPGMVAMPAGKLHQLM
jgi:hypothetical protein